MKNRLMPHIPATQKCAQCLMGIKRATEFPTHGLSRKLPSTLRVTSRHIGIDWHRHSFHSCAWSTAACCVPIGIAPRWQAMLQIALLANWNEEKIVLTRKNYVGFTMRQTDKYVIPLFRFAMKCMYTLFLYCCWAYKYILFECDSTGWLLWIDTHGLCQVTRRSGIN